MDSLGLEDLVTTTEVSKAFAQACAARSGNFPVKLSLRRLPTRARRCVGFLSKVVSTGGLSRLERQSNDLQPVAGPENGAVEDEAAELWHLESAK